MIPLTDYSLFNAITNTLDGAKGVFTTESDAMRMAKKKYGALTLPLFALYWATVERDDQKFNYPAATHTAQLTIKDEDTGDGMKVRLLPVTIRYDLHLWYPKEIQLITAMRELYFFSTNAGGNGVTFDFPELGFDNVGVPLTMELSLSLDKSEEVEMGKYYHGTIAIGAHSWFAKGFDVKLASKIIGDFYESDGPPPDVDSKVGNVEVTA